MVKTKKVLVNKNVVFASTILFILAIICFLQYIDSLNKPNHNGFVQKPNSFAPKGILKIDESCTSPDKHVSFNIQSHSPYNIEYPVQYPIKNPNMYSYNATQPRYNDDHDRIFNPLRFPYKKPVYFSSDCNEIGNEGRNYNNNSYSLGHSSFDSTGRCTTNQLPFNVRTQKWCSTPQQVGILTRQDTTDNTELYPLFGRRKYRHDNKWEYYSIVNGVKVYVKPKSNFDEINNNENISLINFNGDYRVTIYDKETEYDYN
jgi:hypothetical protein